MACPVVLSSEADGRIRLRFIEGRMELAVRLLTVSELLNPGLRTAPPSAEDGRIRGVDEVLEGRMLDVG